MQQYPEKSLGGHSLAGGQAEAHATEASVGHPLARAFLASCGLFVPVPPFSPGFLRSFLGPEHYAEFQVGPQNE